MKGLFASALSLRAALGAQHCANQEIRRRVLAGVEAGKEKVGRRLALIPRLISHSTDKDARRFFLPRHRIGQHPQCRNINWLAALGSFLLCDSLGVTGWHQNLHCGTQLRIRLPVNPGNSLEQFQYSARCA
jgi:hypothetical protein